MTCSRNCLLSFTTFGYTQQKKTTADPRAFHHLDVPFDVSYRVGNVKIQRLSIIPRVPQIEGLFVPSLEVGPHKNALIKLLLFKPLHDFPDMDEQGNPMDPFETLYKLSARAGKRHKRDPDRNPYDAFLDTWKKFWEHAVLPGAQAAKQKLNKRMGWPTIWECEEVFLALMKLARSSAFADTSMSEAEQLQALQADEHAQAKLQNILTIVEYCCFMVRKCATNLDAFARAKAAPKTKSYALDADAVEGPSVHRIQPEDGQN